MIELQHVYKTYYIGDQVIHALEDVNIMIHHGELVSIMGTSGSGKTTTMNIIGLLDRPTSGNYYLNGTEVSKLSSNQLAYLRNRTIGFIFQQFYLLPRLNAIQNVMLPLIYRNVSPKEMHQRALDNLEKVGMKNYIQHKPTELSGGQQQRVAIARALVGDPRIILADEPTGALDSKTSQEVMDLLIQINREEQATVIIVTHDLNIGNQAKRMIKIKDGKVET